MFYHSDGTDSCGSYNSLIDAREGGLFGCKQRRILITADILSASQNLLPAYISIEDLCVSMPGSFTDRLVSKISQTRKINSRVSILHHISAVIPPGSLVAILGTSGSGRCLC